MSDARMNLRLSDERNGHPYQVVTLRDSGELLGGIEEVGPSHFCAVLPYGAVLGGFRGRVWAARALRRVHATEAERDALRAALGELVELADERERVSAQRPRNLGALHAGLRQLDEREAAILVTARAVLAGDGGAGGGK